MSASVISPAARAALTLSARVELGLLVEFDRHLSEDRRHGALLARRSLSTYPSKPHRCRKVRISRSWFSHAYAKLR